MLNNASKINEINDIMTTELDKVNETSEQTESSNWILSLGLIIVLIILITIVIAKRKSQSHGMS